MSQSIPFVPAFIRACDTPLSFADHSLNRPDYPACSKILAKTLVSEDEGGVASCPLPVLSKEECCKQSRHARLCAFLEIIQESPKSTLLTVLLYLLYSCGSAIAMPRGQAYFLEYPAELIKC